MLARAWAGLVGPTWRRNRRVAAVVTMVVACALVAGCSGATPGSIDALPGAAAPLTPADLHPRFLHVTPFTQTKKPIGKSDGQPVYALFTGGFGTRANPATLTVFGAPATSGAAGPMAQLAIVASSTNRQHVYTDSLNRFAELSDAATSAVMLVTYKGTDEVLTTLCRKNVELGIIKETTTNGMTKTKFTNGYGACPSHLDVVASAQPLASADASAPTAATIKFDLCAAGSNVFTSAGDKMTKGARWLSQLKTLGATYAQLSAQAAAACTVTKISVGPPQSPPVCTATEAGSTGSCAYEAPQVPLVPAAAACASASVSAITFNAPGQKCTYTATGNAGSSTVQYTVTSSNASIVTAQPASGSVSGAYSVTLTLTAGTAGGPATVTFAPAGGTSTVISVTNNWATSATPTPSPAPVFNEYAIPTAAAGPGNIVTGPDGALWFTECEQSKIGRITTNGTITEYPTPTGGAQPYQITVGPDGALWFTEELLNQVARITTAGTITEFPVLNAPSEAHFAGITAGPDGALWFAELGANYGTGSQIGRITTTGTATQYVPPTSGSGPWAIVTGPDKALWFTEERAGNIARITTGGAITEFPVASSYAISSRGITVGSDGALWFTEEFGPYQLGRITTAGAITQFAGPAGTSDPYDIVSGPDGALWYTEQGTDQIARVTTSGASSAYLIPTAASYPEGITVGPDNAIWFVEYNGNKIGRLSFPQGSARRRK